MVAWISQKAGVPSAAGTIAAEVTVVSAKDPDASAEQEASSACAPLARAAVSARLETTTKRVLRMISPGAIFAGNAASLAVSRM